MVFNSSLDDAMKNGGLDMMAFVLRELSGLPKAIFYEYLRESRKAKMKKGLDSYFNFVNGSWIEFLVALPPFLLAGGVMPLLGYLGREGIISGMFGAFVVLPLLGLLFTLLIVGARKGLPRWSLPSLGFLMSMLSLYFFSAIFGIPIYLLFRNLRDQSILIIDILWDGIFWHGLLFAIFLLILLSRVSPSFQGFKNDWTLPGFVLYGGVPFALWITFDEYVGDEPYTLLAFLVLAIGAWLYLQNASEWTRFGTLFVAMTLAMFVVAIGKVLLIPSQTWPITIDGGLARSEFRHTITMWVWFALGMMMPLANKFLSRSDDRSKSPLFEG
ncbi:MAG: hypothetical protein FIB03_17600 [Anaerolineae bacterium]|nr:hypothetical protein [Anaerolineae bacterium]